MDFQTHQEEARQNTMRLIVLLVLGITAIVAVVSLLMTGLLYYGSGELQPVSAVAVAAPITTLVIVGTSLVKSSQIKSGGGSYVAESMGGRPVDFNTLDGAEKQLSNVVEEIAIASGMPVPALYVLDDEPGINAFAAGWTADTAAIGVTRGALVHLNRRELQGVIAHEFSHVANGDTRVKTRIIGWVFGIAVITVVGRILLQHLWWAPRRRNRDDNNMVLIVLAAAVGLIVIGSVGALFARMIQAAVSRQREYLADASAVQYTRDPSGIGEALMKIGGMGNGNKIRAAHATESAHLFFSSAFGASFATHPSLKERITRLLPDWNGRFTESAAPQSTVPEANEAAAAAAQADAWDNALPGQVAIPGLPIDPVILAGGSAAGGGGGVGGVGVSSLDGGNGRGFQPPSFGGPTDAHIEHARFLMSQIPEPSQQFLHTRQGAVAAVIGALASQDSSLRGPQLELAGRTVGIDPGYLDAASRVITDLHRSLQLPAVDIALHSIRETPYEHRLALAEAIHTIESARVDQDLFRWMLRRVMLRHLEDQHDDGSDRRTVSIVDLQAEAATVYAILAWFNSSGPSETQHAYEVALVTIAVEPHPVPPIEELTFDRLDEAFERLSRLDRVGREAFVRGATAVVLLDDKTTAEEVELIRIVADAVRLPIPPLLPA